MKLTARQLDASSIELMSHFRECLESIVLPTQRSTQAASELFAAHHSLSPPRPMYLSRMLQLAKCREKNEKGRGREVEIGLIPEFPPRPEGKGSSFQLPERIRLRPLSNKKTERRESPKGLGVVGTVKVRSAARSKCKLYDKQPSQANPIPYSPVDLHTHSTDRRQFQSRRPLIPLLDPVLSSLKSSHLRPVRMREDWDLDLKAWEQHDD